MYKINLRWRKLNLNGKLDDKYDFKTLRKRKTNLVYKFVFIYIVFLFAVGLTQMKLGYSDTVAFIIYTIFCFVLVGYLVKIGYSIENVFALRLLNNLELSEFMDFMQEQHENKKLTNNSAYYNYMALVELIYGNFDKSEEHLSKVKLTQSGYIRGALRGNEIWYHYTRFMLNIFTEKEFDLEELKKQLVKTVSTNQETVQMYNNKLDKIYNVLVLKEPVDNFEEELNDNIVECSKVFNYYVYLCNEVLKGNSEEVNKYIDLLLKYNENYYVVRQAKAIREKN